MRSFILAFGCLVIAACTANVSGFKTPIAQRVQDACNELDSLCTSTGDCLAQQAFCGPSTAPQLTSLFVAEDACKTACSDEWTCIKSCKSTRLTKVNDLLASTDIGGTGTIGTGTSACTSLGNTCTTTGTGCTANEFFCVAAAPAPSPCATQLAECKAACNHDRTCTHACRDTYKSCLSGTTMDAGVPDAPPTTTMYNLTYGTTAGSTGTGTVTVNPMGASCGANCATYAAGTMVTLTATPSTGSTFTKWVGCASTTNTCTVTLSAATTVTATFTMTVTTTNYNLTFGTTAGSTGTGAVAVSPAGTSCGTLCYTYAAGTSVKLTATASTGSTFTKWVGCTSTTNTCTVTVSANMTVTATFTKNTTTAYTYTTDIQPKMTGYCNGCHGGGGSLPGNYATDSYTGLFGNGSDNTPNIIAGDVNSLFVQKMVGNHKNVLTQYPGFDKVATDWVVNNAAAK